MIKNFKFFTVVTGILVFMLLSLVNVQAAGLTWSDTIFTYSASVGVDSFRDPMTYTPGEGASAGPFTNITDPPVGTISSVANVQVTPSSANADLSAGAWGATTANGASASAFASFDLTNLASDEALTATGDAVSWIVRKVTVDSARLYDLHGDFTGTIDFAAFGLDDSTYHALSTYTGAVRLDEFAVVSGSGIMNLSTWELSIDDMRLGTNMIEDILMRPFDDDLNPIYYNLTVGFTGGGLNVDVSNLQMPFINRGEFPEDIYQLGNAANPLIINGGLAPVPVPGTLLLLLSGLAGLFGFKLSLNRRGSSNS